LIKWRKSSLSGGTDENCVEIAHLPGAIAIRDSKDPRGPMLVISGSFPENVAVRQGG
jgi:hypothetical protein